MIRKSLALTTLAGVLALTACSQEQRDTAAQQATETLKLDHDDVFSLKVGSCFNNTAELENDESIETLPMRDCAEPHDNEVFHIYTYPDAPTIPSDAQIDATAESECMPAFQEFIGLDYHQSQIEMSVFYPSAESWIQGDRELVCYVFDGATQTTGSLKGANR